VDPDEVRAHIEHTARSFDAQLHAKNYAEVHSDSAQLRRLLSFLSPRAGEVYLDLGTGNGYVAIAVAKECPRCRVIGVDITTAAIGRNVENARRDGLSNVQFQTFDGVLLPFPDNHFSGVMCRYAFHHFPRPETSLKEIRRTLHAGGRFVLADATRSDDDDTDFINVFQVLKRDGHVKMYRAAELLSILGHHGFSLVDQFESSISFRRSRNVEYDRLLASTSARVREAYSVAICGEEVRLTFPILNVLFLNREEES
jgi:ubiquinone/menaquinone biosynthesis C-methylase UbiE